MIVFASDCQSVIMFVTPDGRINLFSRIFPNPLELKWNCCTFWNKIDFAPQNWMIHWVEVPNQKVCAALLLYRGLQIGIVWLASTLCCWLDQTERVFRPQIPIRKFWDSGSLAISTVLRKKAGNKSGQFQCSKTVEQKNCLLANVCVFIGLEAPRNRIGQKFPPCLGSIQFFPNQLLLPHNLIDIAFFFWAIGAGQNMRAICCLLALNSLKRKIHDPLILQSKGTQADATHLTLEWST